VNDTQLNGFNRNAQLNASFAFFVVCFSYCIVIPSVIMLSAMLVMIMLNVTIL
jgi:hypothetical protein